MNKNVTVEDIKELLSKLGVSVHELEDSRLIFVNDDNNEAMKVYSTSSPLRFVPMSEVKEPNTLEKMIYEREFIILQSPNKFIKYYLVPVRKPNGERFTHISEINYNRKRPDDFIENTVASFDSNKRMTINTIVYSDNSRNDGNFFQMSDNDDNIFILKTNKAFFDFSSIKGTNGRFTTLGKVGLYNQNGELIEKLDILFEVYEPATICYPNKYTKGGGNNYKRSKKVINYIKKESGFVRFILPLHNTTDEFDLKVPTLNN